MSVPAQMHREMSRLEGVQASPANPYVVAIGMGPDCFEAKVEAVDSIGCTLHQINLNTERLQQASIDQLKCLSESLASRLIYLLEPITPVEIDKDGASVQLRSNPPLKNDNATSYFELLVRRSEISMCRYQKSPHEVRQVVAAQLTREVIGRLADDFLSTVASF